MAGFHLTKWYLDCVADDGSTVIGYFARLSWRSLSLEYAAALVAPAGTEPRQVHALRSPPAPVLDGSQCLWQCMPLQLEGRWVADSAPIQADLLTTSDGGIRWSVHQPRAICRVHLAGMGEITGLGYVESLELTIPPWRLPFNTLYWGRFLSRDHALVWLQWEERPGKHGRRFAVLDGAATEEVAVTEDSVLLPGAAAGLDFNTPRLLRHGPIAATVLGGIPRLVNVLPERFRLAHESKRLSHAELHLPAGDPVRGWSISEVVTW